MKRFVVETFGCQMNAHDSRRIEEVLEAAGWEATDEATLADLVVINTCSVREKAEHKLMSMLGTLRPLKLGGRRTVLAVAGCVAQQEGERLLARAPHVDLVLGPDRGGGYTLAGLRAPCDELFTGVTMSSAGMCAATEALARARGLAVERLSEDDDVDTPADLARLRARLAASNPEFVRHTRAALAELSRRFPALHP